MVWNFKIVWRSKCEPLLFVTQSHLPPPLHADASIEMALNCSDIKQYMNWKPIHLFIAFASFRFFGCCVRTVRGMIWFIIWECGESEPAHPGRTHILLIFTIQSIDLSSLLSHIGSNIEMRSHYWCTISDIRTELWSQTAITHISVWTKFCINTPPPGTINYVFTPFAEAKMVAVPLKVLATTLPFQLEWPRANCIFRRSLHYAALPTVCAFSSLISLVCCNVIHTACIFNSYWTGGGDTRTQFLFSISFLA